MKKKSPKYSSYLAQCLVNEGKSYILIVNNIQKLIMILIKREEKKEESKTKPTDFFKIDQS